MSWLLWELGRMATHGSLFSGIGGIDLGFEWAGIDTLWQVEIDPYCRNLLEMRFPNAARYEDVNKVGSHNLQPVDIISGGFPCQDISYAGKGAGIDGSRSGLWSQLHRVIGELRPRFALIENVPALLKRGLDRVLSDLADIGYDAEWQVISAKDVGAPHLRKRVWIVAYTQHSADRTNGGQEGEKKSVQGINREEGRSGLSGRTGCNATDVADTEGGLCEGIDGREESSVRFEGRSEAVADTGSGRLQGGENTGNNQGEGQVGWLPEPDVGRVAHGIPSRVDRLKGLGNAVVPHIPHLIGVRLKYLIDQTNYTM